MQFRLENMIKTYNDEIFKLKLLNLYIYQD